ncbi:hypothetical protein [Kytococcus sedentarius]|uniref:hypothetical protein n=1 Tax=Kytococcus sedentarius TaxID=1276 RepID=UPI0035BBBB86
MSPRATPTSNPAQRLYEILERHEEALGDKTNAMYNSVWSETLQVDSEDVTTSIAQAFALISDIERALEVTGDEHQRRIFALNKESWSRAFIPLASGRNNYINQGGTSEQSRAALGGLASHLRDNFIEGRLPSEEQATELRAQVAELIDDIGADEHLPAQIADLMNRRLHDMLWALDHIAIMGPDGISSAAERMAVAYGWVSRTIEQEGLRVEDENDSSSLAERFKTIASKGLDVVSIPGAWYGSWQAVNALAPVASDALQRLPDIG